MEYCSCKSFHQDDANLTLLTLLLLLVGVLYLKQQRIVRPPIVADDANDSVPIEEPIVGERNGGLVGNFARPDDPLVDRDRLQVQ